jgi:hypothetical protein
MKLRFRDHVLENVYLCTSEDQRREIMAFWLEHKAVSDPNERARRSHEVAVMVRNGEGELAGLSTVGLTRVGDGRIFYAYRMFIRPRDRVPYLMSKVTNVTRDTLRDFAHPQGPVAGLLIVTENPKLMRPGMKREFERQGYHYQGKTPQGLDVWAVEFGATAGS